MSNFVCILNAYKYLLNGYANAGFQNSSTPGCDKAGFLISRSKIMIIKTSRKQLPFSVYICVHVGLLNPYLNK